MFTIGIAGGTGSGKTTVVKKILERIPKDRVALVPQDSYYKDSSHLPLEERQEINFDHPDSLEFDLLVEEIDIKVFVDADSDDRLGRVIMRDMMERGRSVKTVLERYEKTVKPMHLQFIEPSKRYADIIVPQGGMNEVAISVLLNTIEKMLNL